MLKKEKWKINSICLMKMGMRRLIKKDMKDKVVISQCRQNEVKNEKASL